MASQRSKKSRSLGIEPVPPRPATSSQRPDLGDRHNSAPIAAQLKQSGASRLLQGSKGGSASKRSSKASSRDEQVSGRTSEVYSSDRHGRSSKTAKSSATSNDLRYINLVVLGNPAAGKTGFIRNALDLRKPATSPVSSSKVCLGGILYRVQLIELLVGDVGCEGSEGVSWPTTINNLPFPYVDGAFCLYDVTDGNSITGLPKVLTALTKSEIPCSLVLCKVDRPEAEQEIGAAFARQVRNQFEGVTVGEATVDSSESAQRCLLQAMKLVLGGTATFEDRFVKASQPNSRAPSVGPTHDSSRASSTSRSRSRSRPALTPRTKSKEQLNNAIRLQPSPVKEIESLPDGRSKIPQKTQLRIDTNTLLSNSNRQTEPQTPVSFTEHQTSRVMSPSDRAVSTVPETPESITGNAIPRPGTADTADSKLGQTFLNVDDESVSEDMIEQSPAAATEKLHQLTLQESNRSEGGVPFSDLVDRLLQMPTTKSSSKFVPSFLCLYRAFATPAKLLTAIIERFVKIERSDLVQFTKVAEQLRYLSVLAQWTANYPGDFANSTVRELAITFVKDIEKSRSFAPAAKEVSNNLHLFVPDEDEDWAYGDMPNSGRSRANTSTRKKLSNDALQKSSDRVTKEQDSDESDSGDNDDDADASTFSPHHSATTSSASSLLKSGNTSSQSAINLIALESAREQAKQLRSVAHIRLSKVQWHQFMETPTDDLAREITRINWTMFSAIRPRDFVRQATASSAQRARPAQLDIISMMTKQFNHLTFFVSAMILLRDKPKHRAKMLEKFMDLAWKVRQQNNYQSLGAIVAAIKGEEIMRLAQTNELIPAETHKNFWKLRILMDHTRSHSAYRMAWENSSRERIPFLPRVQEDLFKAAIGNPTFIGTNVKWSKFEVMGETIVSVQRSQEQPYSFPEKTQKSQEICRLILETRILEGAEDSDDPRFELFERSKQVEPLTASGDAKKKFDWLRR